MKATLILPDSTNKKVRVSMHTIPEPHHHVVLPYDTNIYRVHKVVHLLFPDITGQDQDIELYLQRVRAP